MKMPESPVVTLCKPFDMQVCVPKRWTRKQIKAFADRANICGTSWGWSVRKRGSRLLDGCPEKVPCEERKGYVHVMLDA